VINCIFNSFIAKVLKKFEIGDDMNGNMSNRYIKDISAITYRT